MTTFRLRDPDEFVPSFARGKHLPIKEIRLHLSNGSILRIKVPPGQQRGEFTFEVTDGRVVRHLTADPRFVRVS